MTGSKSPSDVITTGYPSLDKFLSGGMRRGELITLGGDAGSGKSSLAMSIALKAKQAGGKAAFYTAEMSRERALERMRVMEERPDPKKQSGSFRILSDSDEPGNRIMLVADSVEPEPFDAPEIVAISPGRGVDALSERIQKEGELDLAVVDHLQALASDGRPLDEELASAVRKLKAAAMEQNCAILLVSHCEVDRAHSPVPRPVLSDFGALGAVKQHSDAVLALYREEMYENVRGIDGATELHVLKNRHGGTGYVDLYLYKQWMRFEDMV